ncbi:hypothetical protein Tco_0684724, partial [Tanacetum coccineum]
MSKNEDRYHDTVQDLEAKLKKNVDLILKLGNSLQGMFMLRLKPLSVYDQQLKHGLGYMNPYTLKQAISQCPKLYLASSLGNSEISLNVKDNEDTLDDASKSQQKVNEKMNDPIAVANKQNYNSLHAEIEQLKKKSIEIQEGLQARIKILELKNDAASSVRKTNGIEIHTVKNSVLANSKEASKEKFSKESTLSKSLDTTYVVSKPKIDVGSTSKVNDKVVQIVLWIVNSGFSKHMTGDRSLLKNFIEKFMGIVCFGNDHFAAITGYGDYVQGNITICHVYYVEGLGHNLFSVGQFQCNKRKKAQLQAKTTLICNLKNEIKSVKEGSNEAKLKKEINVLETINIKLESSVAKLLAENEKLNKENEHLKQTYKELYDSIKKTRIQTKDHNDSLIAQVNSKTVENADLKAQIQEKVFANAALKNELRKLNGTSVDTKFAKPSILGKPVLQPHRNQSVVRQPNAFKSERPNFSKPRFASQVDVNNVLSKPVTPHYLPKVREYVLAKPHHVIAPGSSRNSQEESYGSNDMAHNHYLEEARKKTQERNRNSKPSVMPSVRLQNTANGSTPNPKRTNQTSRSLPTSKSSCVTITVVPKADHSRNSSSFSDSKHFFCSTCHKCVFNANHDACITKLLNEVNSHKVKSHKTKNSNNPVEQKSHTQKPGRQIFSGHRFSPKKTSVVYEKTSPRSCLRWKPTGKIFTTVGLKWIPTGKLFDSCTSKVDSEPPNGSNDDITNPYECDQTLNVSAGTLNLSA